MSIPKGHVSLIHQHTQNVSSYLFHSKEVSILFTMSTHKQKASWNHKKTTAKQSLVPHHEYKQKSKIAHILDVMYG